MCTNVSAAPAASIHNADGDKVAGSSELLATIYQTTSAPYTSKMYSSKIFTQDRHQKPTENSATYFACKKYQCSHAYRR
jgi:hypothetical protein